MFLISKQKGMRNWGRALLLFSILIVHYSYSQEVVHFTKGLAINGVYRYGREALYTDLLAWQLFTNTLKRPAEGATFGTNERGQAIAWQAVTADSINRFRT